jgi:hypothetical protein
MVACQQQTYKYCHREKVLKTYKISLFFVLLVLILIATLVVHASPSIDITVTTTKQTYKAGESVTVYGDLTKDGIPTTDGLVGIEVRGPSDKLLTIRTVTTVRKPFETPYVELLSVTSCNSAGDPKESFQRGNINIYFILNGVNHDIEWRYVLITVRAHTPQNMPYGGWAVEQFPLAPRETPSDPPRPFSVGPISMPIDPTVPLGNWTVYANVFTGWPREEVEPGVHGTPYCAEVSATFLITDGVPPPPTAPPTSEANGNYNLTFTLPSSAKGNYTIYASSRYYGRETFNSTTFNVIPWYMRADLDEDGDVDEDDLWTFCGAFITYYKTSSVDPRCDFDYDNDIDEDDLWTFCSAFIQYYK